MNAFWFIAFPYLALVLAIGVGIYRGLARPFTETSLSSQLLENRKLFWGSVPWHYGITLILLAHLFAWLFPGAAAFILGGHIRLVVLEMIGIALSFFALFGLIVLIIRRLPMKSLSRSVTSYMDGVMLAFLLAQVATGVSLAIFERWGGLWYLKTAVPWVWSIFTLHPNMATVIDLPGFVKVHFVLGFAIILLFPFTRLVHLVRLPIHYLWRPYQVVIWNRRSKRPAEIPSETFR
ncbi:MAG: respiratory nitrate reductase subunit gamma [Terriglobia bacterium]